MHGKSTAPTALFTNVGNASTWFSREEKAVEMEVREWVQPLLFLM